MAITKEIIQNTCIYTIPKFSGYIMSFITLPIITRILQPADFGIIVLAGILPTLAAGIFSCGLSASAQRYYFEYRNDPNKYNAMIVSLQVFLYASFFISGSLIFVFRNHIAKFMIGSEVYGTAVFIAYLNIFLTNIIFFYLNIYQNMEKAKINSFFTLLQGFLAALFNVILVIRLKTYMGMLLGAFLSAVIVCFTLALYFNRMVVFAYSSGILLKNIAYGMQMLPKQFTGFINRFFDKYMINNMLSTSAVGVYNIGQSIGNIMHSLMSALWAALQPTYYKLVFDKGKDAAGEVGRIFTLFVYISVLPLILVILFSQEIIYLIAPANYYGAINIIVLVVAGISFNIFGIYIGIQYAYSKKPFLIFPITIASTLTNVAANIMLIPKMGIIGAGMSFIISMFILNLLLTFVGQKLYFIKYEWKSISLLYTLIFSSAGTVLYLRYIQTEYYIILPIKILLIIIYLFIGYSADIVNKEKVLKFYHMLFKHKDEGVSEP